MDVFNYFFKSVSCEGRGDGFVVNVISQCPVQVAARFWTVIWYEQYLQECSHFIWRGAEGVVAFRPSVQFRAEGVVAFRPSVQFRVGYYHLDYIIIKEVIEDFYRTSEVTWRIERFCTPLESVRKLAGQVDFPPFSADRCCGSKNSSPYLERVGAGGRGGGKTNRTA